MPEEAKKKRQREKKKTTMRRRMMKKTRQSHRETELQGPAGMHRVENVQPFPPEDITNTGFEHVVVFACLNQENESVFFFTYDTSAAKHGKNRFK